MTKLVWDADSQRIYETGVEKGVVYPQDNTGKYPKGAAWNGLISVTESPSGAEPTALWANNTKYGELVSNEEFGGSIEAYMYPDEFAACDGSAQPAPGLTIRQQNRKAFGLTYQTKLGNDTEGTDYGYVLHLVYGAKASPSERSRQTINDSPEAMTLSWEFSTTPAKIETINPDTNKPYKHAAHLEISSITTEPEKLAAIEAILYGSDEKEPMLPSPDEVIAILTGTTTE